MVSSQAPRASVSPYVPSGTDGSDSWPSDEATIDGGAPVSCTTVPVGSPRSSRDTSGEEADAAGAGSGSMGTPPRSGQLATAGVQRPASPSAGALTSRASTATSAAPSARPPSATP